MAEGMQPALGIERGTIGRSKDNAGSSDGSADCAGTRDAHAHCAGCLVACSSDDRRSRSQAGGLGPRGGYLSTNRRRFVQRRKQANINAGLAQNFGGPAAVGDIEKKRARRVRHIDGTFSREPESHVVFGQHHVRDAGPVRGLGLAHPKEFGEREIGERRIAGQLDQRIAAKQFLQFVRLCFAALIAPDDRVAHDFVGGVEQDGTVHLSRESHACNFVRAEIRRPQRLADRGATGAPPVTRILFGPTRPRTGEGLVVFRSGSDDLPRGVHQKRTGTACSYVDSKVRDISSSKFPLKARSQRVRPLGEVFRQFAICFPGLLFFLFN